MRSRVELNTAAFAAGLVPQSLGHRSVAFIAFGWGLCAYFPIGVMYLNLLLFMSAWAIAPELRRALRRLRCQPVLLPLLLFVAWTFLAALAGDWFADTPTRLFHTVRVALVLCLGMMLTVVQARYAFAGFATGSVVAASIVTLHHLWGMPDWALWSSLLTSRNNFSSGNMITMATACGACFVLALGRQVERGNRWLLFAMALVFGTVVVMHGVSRNAQLLLAGLLLVSLSYRFRSAKAAAGGLASIALLALAVWQLSPTTSTRFIEMADELHAATTAQNYSTSVGVRWRMYEEAVHGMAEHPLLGVGVGYWLPHWHAVWQELASTQPPEARTFFLNINNPHNDFLLTGMETGVPGMLLLIWWLAVLVRTGWRGLPPWGGLTLVIAMSIIGTALVNAPLRDAAIGMTLLWLLGASVALQSEATDA